LGRSMLRPYKSKIGMTTPRRVRERSFGSLRSLRMTILVG